MERLITLRNSVDNIDTILLSWNCLINWVCSIEHNFMMSVIQKFSWFLFRKLPYINKIECTKSAAKGHRVWWWAPWMCVFNNIEMFSIASAYSKAIFFLSSHIILEQELVALLTVELETHDRGPPKLWHPDMQLEETKQLNEPQGRLSCPKVH